MPHTPSQSGKAPPLKGEGNGTIVDQRTRVQERRNRSDLRMARNASRSKKGTIRHRARPHRQSPGRAREEARLTQRPHLHAHGGIRRGGDRHGRRQREGQARRHRGRA